LGLHYFKPGQFHQWSLDFRDFFSFADLEVLRQQALDHHHPSTTAKAKYDPLSCILDFVSTFQHFSMKFTSCPYTWALSQSTPIVWSIVS